MGALGSCSVWKFCTRASTDSGPKLPVSPTSCASVDCDVMVTRSARSAKYVSSETRLKFT